MRTLLLQFPIPLKPSDTEAWRGAFIQVAGMDEDLIHNHSIDGGDLNRYPLVQYRSSRGLATIVAWGEGVASMERLMPAYMGKPVDINGMAANLLPSKLLTGDFELSASAEARLRFYSLRNWIPLNSATYQQWAAADPAGQKDMLEKLLATQIITFAKAMGVRLPKFRALLLEVGEPHKRMVHGNPLLAFNAKFTADLDLPQGMAIGRAVALGYGTISAKLHTAPNL